MPVTVRQRPAMPEKDHTRVGRALHIIQCNSIVPIAFRAFMLLGWTIQLSQSLILYQVWLVVHSLDPRRQEWK
jgi:hypothetical protein